MLLLNYYRKNGVRASKNYLGGTVSRAPALDALRFCYLTKSPLHIAMLTSAKALGYITFSYWSESSSLLLPERKKQNGLLCTPVLKTRNNQTAIFYVFSAHFLFWLIIPSGLSRPPDS